MSLEDAVAHVVACVITHEACHFLGCWHTENSNSTISITDRGGNLANLAGIGNDGILGTADDQSPTIHDDNFAFEGVGRSQDIQNVRAQVIASLSVGESTPSDESAAVSALIAGFETAKRQQLGIDLPSQYNSLSTRKILGLQVDPPLSSFQPNVESPAGRIEKVFKKLNSRLEELKDK
jgi:hypothetical protein